MNDVHNLALPENVQRHIFSFTALFLERNALKMKLNNACSRSLLCGAVDEAVSLALISRSRVFMSLEYRYV